jgi:hypothetical protein
MTTKRHTLLALTSGAMLAAAIAVPSAAQADLVYKPINPAFGGDPFVGAFLMDTALSQSRYHEDDKFPDIEIPEFSEVIVVPPAGSEAAAAETTAPQVD